MNNLRTMFFLSQSGQSGFGGREEGNNRGRVIIAPLQPPLRLHYCIQLKNVQHFLFEKRVKETEPLVKFRVSQLAKKGPGCTIPKVGPVLRIVSK